MIWPRLPVPSRRSTGLTSSARRSTRIRGHRAGVGRPKRAPGALQLGQHGVAHPRETGVDRVPGFAETTGTIQGARARSTDPHWWTRRANGTGCRAVLLEVDVAALHRDLLFRPGSEDHLEVFVRDRAAVGEPHAQRGILEHGPAGTDAQDEAPATELIEVPRPCGR